MDKRFTYLVEKYLENDLEGSEKQEFENFLREPSCADYLARAEKAERIIEKGMRQILEEEEATDVMESLAYDIPEGIAEDVRMYGGKANPEFREKLRKIHRDMVGRRKKVRIIWYVAAAAAMVAGIIFLVAVPGEISPQKLYKRYYLPHEFTAYRSVEETGPVYERAIQSYSSHRYSESTGICREVIASGTRQPGVYFLYGLNLMEMDSMENAIRHFSYITSSPDGKEESLYIPAQWYTSLAYLSLGRVDSVLIRLEQLINADRSSAMGKKAQELYGRLKKR